MNFFQKIEKIAFFSFEKKQKYLKKGKLLRKMATLPPNMDQNYDAESKPTFTYLWVICLQHLDPYRPSYAFQCAMELALHICVSSPCRLHYFYRHRHVFHQHQID